MKKDKQKPTTPTVGDLMGLLHAFTKEVRTSLDMMSGTTFSSEEVVRNDHALRELLDRADALMRDTRSVAQGTEVIGYNQPLASEQRDIDEWTQWARDNS